MIWLYINRLKASLMNKSFSILIGIICLFAIYSWRNSGSNKQKNIESKPAQIEQEKQQKETSTLYLPIGGFTPGFIYCGFDGDKSKLTEMNSQGWQIVSVNPQNFQTSKRNGDRVSCNGNLYIFERYQ